MNKIFNIPNSISIFRILILSPLVGYLVYIGEIYWALVVGAAIIGSDILDGSLARKLRQQTNLGTTLDATGDTVYMAVLVFMFLYLGYIDWQILAMFVVHRVTRGCLAMYVGIKTRGIYTPKHIKLTGFIPMIYIFFIPILVHQFSQRAADIVTWAILGSTYLALIVSAIVAVVLLRKGKIQATHLEKVKVKDVIEEKDKIKKKIKEKKKTLKKSTLQ